MASTAARLSVGSLVLLQFKPGSTLLFGYVRAYICLLLVQVV